MLRPLIDSEEAETAPPTYKLPPIPTPPATVNAPEVVEFASDLSKITTRFVAEILPLTFKFPLIPTPPATCNAPVCDEKESVLL